MTRPFALALYVVIFMIASPPARGADLAWYCTALKKFERSCTGVKGAVALFGRDRALRYAKACGGSDAEIDEALACIAPKPNTSEVDRCPPVWQCNGSRETNAPSCYHKSCRQR